MNKFYWFEFDTNEISDSLPNPVRWTPYNYCGVQDGNNFNCTGTSAAFPFKPQEAFGTTNGIPSDIIENESTYFYLTRIAYAFYIISAVFLFVTFLFSFLACCSRLGGALGAFISFITFLFIAAASSMITANYVMAKNAFADEGVRAKLGVKMFAFTWTVVACSLLSFILLCFTCTRGRRGRQESAIGESSSARPLNRESSFERIYDDKPARTGRGFFHVSRKRPEDQEFYQEEPVVQPAPVPQ